MKKIMTTMLVAAMVLSMAAPATAATPARDLEAASQKAATKATTAYTLKMSNKTLKFYRNGKVVRSEETKDGKVTLKKSSAGGISVLFTTKEGKTKNITLGKQMDITLEGTFVQISADKTLTKAHTIRLKKGSKATSFYARAAAKYVLSGTVSTLNVTNKNAQVKVEGTVTKAYTVSKSAISGLASSKITVNKTGTAAGRTGTNTSNSSGRDTYYSNGSSSTGGGSNSGIVNPPSNGGNNNRPDTKPDDKPKEENVVAVKYITDDYTGPATFDSDVTIVTGGKTLRIENCTFNGKVTVVDSLNKAARTTAKPGKVIFENSTATNNITLSQPVGIETDETTKVNKIEVAEKVVVPEIVVKGDVGAVDLATGSTASKVTIQGNASTEVSGDGEVGEVTLVAETNKAPSATITAKVTDKITTDGTGSVGTISVGGNNSSATVEINHPTKQVTVADSVQAEVKVKKTVTVDKVVAVTDGSSSGRTDTKVVVSGGGTVTKAEAVGDATVETGDSTTNVPEPEKITLSGITVTAPKKVDYYEGEKLDLSGMSVVGNYGNDTKVVITKGYTVDPAAGTVLKTTNNKVTVTYDSKSGNFDITVKEAELASLGIIPGEVTLTKTGAEEKLAVKQVWLGTPASGKDNVTIKVKNPEIATATAEIKNGIYIITVKAVKDGTTQISATVNGKTINVPVTVDAKAEILTVTGMKQGTNEISEDEGVYFLASKNEIVNLVFNSSYERTEQVSYSIKDGEADAKTGKMSLKKGENTLELFDGKAAPTVGKHEFEVTVDGKTMKVTAYVNPVAAVTGVTVTPEKAKIEKGKTVDLKANVSVVGTVEDNKKEVSWTIAEKAAKEAGAPLATLDKTTGNEVTLTAGEAGVGKTVVVTATVDKNGANKTATAEVEIIEDALTALKACKETAHFEAFLGEPLYVADCGLNLTEFNKLDADKKTAVYRELVNGSNTTTYQTLKEFAAAFDLAISSVSDRLSTPVITLNKTEAANRAEDVTFTVAPGNAEETDVTFYYTLDGTEPTAKSTKYANKAVAIPKQDRDEEVTVTVKVIGVKKGGEGKNDIVSKVATAKVTYVKKGQDAKLDAPAFSETTVTKKTGEATSVDLTLTVDAPTGATYQVYEGTSSTVSKTVTANVDDANKKKLTLTGKSKLNAGTYYITVKVGSQESGKTAVTVNEQAAATARAVVNESTIDVALSAGAFASPANAAHWTIGTAETPKAGTEAKPVSVTSVKLNPYRTVATLTLSEGATITQDSKYTVTMTQAALAEGFTAPEKAIEVKVEEAATIKTTIKGDTAANPTGGTSTVDNNGKTITFSELLKVYELRSTGFPPKTTCWVGIELTPNDNTVTQMYIDGESVDKLGDHWIKYFDMRDAEKTSEGASVSKDFTVRWTKPNASRAMSAEETFTIVSTAGVEDYNTKTPVTVTAKYVDSKAASAAESTATGYDVEVTLANGAFDGGAETAANWKLNNTVPSSVTVAAKTGSGRYDNYPQKVTLHFNGTKPTGEATLNIEDVVFIPDTKTVDNNGASVIENITVTDSASGEANVEKVMLINNSDTVSTVTPEPEKPAEPDGEVKNPAKTPDSETPTEGTTGEGTTGEGATGEGTTGEGTTEPSVTDTEKEPNGPKTEKPAEPTPETTPPVEGSDTTANGETTEAEGQPEDKADAKTEPTTLQADK